MSTTDPRPGRLRVVTVLRTLLVLCATGLLADVGSAAHATARQDLSPLFAPPSTQELDDVRADWASRPIVDAGYRIEATGTDPNGAQVHVVSHLVEGQRHFAGVRFPLNYDPSGVYRTMLLCHGGLVGVNLDDITNVLTILSGGCLDDESFLVVPSFRGEELETSFAGTFVSGGLPSPADRDVDDVLSLLSVVLRNYPQMDDARVHAWGVSRGASVALLCAIRDARVRRVVDNFGFTDMSLPSVRARVDEIQNLGVSPVGIGQIVWEAAANPWLTGTLTLEEARLAWIRKSPCFFADSLGEVQAHHGLADTQVDASHTSVLLDALANAGGAFPGVQGYFYPSGQHNVNSLVGYGPRALDFLCFGNSIEPRGFCGPMRPTALGLYAAADYRGTPSIAAADFVFRANDLLPNGAGLVFVGSSTGYTPAGAGFLCLGAGLQRAGLALADGNGTFELPIDFASLNPLLDPIYEVGAEVSMQVVFRDPANPLGNYNFSNGLTVTVLP
ncbi:MAG: hypothetical protein AAFU73_13280 [Planctomycetota bacterium]